MSKEVKKQYITWKQVEEYVDAVVNHVKANNISIDGVFGPPRGGLIFAVMLSHRLNVPMLMSPYGNCLIVDDIADTGKSLYPYRRNPMLLDTFFITTMFWVESSLVKPDFYWKEKKDNTWVVYPWENIETEAARPL